MSLPDNRIRYSSALIDFDTEVGVASQDHDTFPEAGQQARFDWMRITLIGLLANQSSFDEPTQYRDGTTWYDLNTSELKVRIGSSWQSIAEAIVLDTEEDESTLTLAEWYANAQATLAASAPEITFGGSSSTDGVVSIPIPESLRSGLYSDTRPFVYRNGILLDPRLTSLEPSAAPTAVQLSGVSLSNGDTFTVLLKRMPAANFYVPDVTV